MTTITVEERKLSRAGSDDDRRRRYLIRGTDDDHAAMQAARATIGQTLVNGMRLDKIQLEELSLNPPIFEAVATYARRPDSKSLVYNFDISVENIRAKRSLETIASYAPEGKEPPNFHQAVNVQPDGKIEGAEVPFPLARFSYSLSADAGFVTEAYQDYLETLVASVNSLTFRGRAPGSVMFLGATGTQRYSAESREWSLEFHFLRRPNRTGITLGDITGINVEGFDYLWAYYESAPDAAAKSFAIRPRAAYVERLNHRADLNQIFRGVP